MNSLRVSFVTISNALLTQHGIGGGGYTGGYVNPTNDYNTAYPNAGATSFNDGEDKEGQPGANNGNGFVTIEYLGQK